MSQALINIPDDELMGSGHLACAGCGATLAMRFVLKALGPKTVLTIPACCWSVIDGPMPHSCLTVPLYHTAFETAAASAAGIRAALTMKGDTETTVVAWAGDGGTFDIGIQALSACAERNEDIIYVCYDNEAYMNTGIQRSSATPWGAWTTTTPEEFPKENHKKQIVEILAAHWIPYVATASVAFPEDLVRKVKKARAIRGTRFIHILSPCPPGWRAASDMSVTLTHLAVLTRAFPLYEVEEGVRYRLNYIPARELPIEAYIKNQGRFKHLTNEQIEFIQKRVDLEWNRVYKKAKDSGSVPARKGIFDWEMEKRGDEDG
ncbi:MAG: 3-methyl-2-oxobutanoate dehydrogenase subunit beta [Candidatus Glassbacteria bacterium]